MSRTKYLLDVNVLMALTQTDHRHFEIVLNWFNRAEPDWAVCALTETGFLRLSSHPSVGKLTVPESFAILKGLRERPGYSYWPIVDSWETLTAPFIKRVFGFQQVTDALLFGLAVKEGGILVTLDRGIEFITGKEYAKHLLVLS